MIYATTIFLQLCGKGVKYVLIGYLDSPWFMKLRTLLHFCLKWESTFWKALLLYSSVSLISLHKRILAIHGYLIVFSRDDSVISKLRSSNSFISVRGTPFLGDSEKGRVQKVRLGLYSYVLHKSIVTIENLCCNVQFDPWF